MVEFIGLSCDIFFCLIFRIWKKKKMMRDDLIIWHVAFYKNGLSLMQIIWWHVIICCKFDARNTYLPQTTLSPPQKPPLLLRTTLRTTLLTLSDGRQHTHTHLPLPRMYVHVCICMCPYVRMYVHVCICMCPYVCMYVCMSVRMYVCTYVCMYVCR